MKNKIVIYTDGGARGNPGHAAIGVVIGDKEYGEYIGKTTNNIAEYSAVIFGLKKAKHLFGKDDCAVAEVEIRADSELVVRRMEGAYKIKEPELQKLFIEIWNLKTEFKKVSFVHIPREENSKADKLVNKALDERLF